MGLSVAGYNSFGGSFKYFVSVFVFVFVFVSVFDSVFVLFVLRTNKLSLLRDFETKWGCQAQDVAGNYNFLTG